MVCVVLCANVFAGKVQVVEGLPEKVPFARLLANPKCCSQKQIELTGVFSFKSRESFLYLDSFSYESSIFVNSMPINESFDSALIVLDGKVAKITGRCVLIGKSRSKVGIDDVVRVRWGDDAVWEGGKIIVSTEIN